MSEAWEGGKGDKSRIANRESYRDNYDMIFNKNKKNRNLFLDDRREVDEAWLFDSDTLLTNFSGIDNWIIVRSYDEFVRWIDMNGIPDNVSFDHDLCEDAMVQFENALANNGFIDYVKYTQKTGKHCAEYLVKSCKEKNIPIPNYYIHTANHLAAPIIRDILENGKAK